MNLRQAALTFILLIICTLLLPLPQWIPSWGDGVQHGINSLVMLSFLAGIFLVVKFIGYVHEKKMFSIYNIFAILIVAGIWMFSFLFAFFAFGENPSKQSCIKTHHFSEHGVTAYIYSSGFLDPAATVKVEDRILPIMHDLHTFAIKAEDVYVEQQQERIIFSDGDRVIEYNVRF